MSQTPARATRHRTSGAPSRRVSARIRRRRAGLVLVRGGVVAGVVWGPGVVRDLATRVSDEDALVELRLDGAVATLVAPAGWAVTQYPVSRDTGELRSPDGALHVVLTLHEPGVPPESAAQQLLESTGAKATTSTGGWNVEQPRPDLVVRHVDAAAVADKRPRWAANKPEVGFLAVASETETPGASGQPLVVDVVAAFEPGIDAAGYRATIALLIGSLGMPS